MDHSALGLVSSTRFTMRNEKYNELDKDLDSATIIIGNTSHCIGLTSDVLNPLKNSGHQKKP